MQPHFTVSKQSCFEPFSDRPEIIEVHSSYPNTALQVASVLPAGGDLPDEILFPNQTIPVLPENHWATESGEIWVPVDKDDQETTHQLVFAVYSNLDVLFGEEIEASFFSVDIDEDLGMNSKQLTPGPTICPLNFRQEWLRVAKLKELLAYQKRPKRCV